MPVCFEKDGVSGHIVLRTTKYMAEEVKLKTLTKEELNNRCTENADELLQARRRYRTGEFKKTSEFLRLRKDIARIKTQLRFLEINEAAGNKTEKKRV